MANFTAFLSANPFVARVTKGEVKVRSWLNLNCASPTTWSMVPTKVMGVSVSLSTLRSATTLAFFSIVIEPPTVTGITPFMLTLNSGMIFMISFSFVNETVAVAEYSLASSMTILPNSFLSSALLIKEAEAATFFHGDLISIARFFETVLSVTMVESSLLISDFGVSRMSFNVSTPSTEVLEASKSKLVSLGSRFKMANRMLTGPVRGKYGAVLIIAALGNLTSPHISKPVTLAKVSPVHFSTAMASWVIILCSLSVS